MIDQKLNEAAGWILGWEPGQKCPQGSNRYPTNVNVDGETGRHTHCVDCHFDYTAHEYKKLGEHDISAPDFSDWRVAGAALEALIKYKGHVVLADGPDLKTAIALSCAKLGGQQNAK